ncbi:hypothetical protein LIER_41379 [Lithospermum erythrorhizon]|uniref:DUF4283 domain-containing protein n=1 Tax=Lithospermum erythrorhizon TaxID=34254 RepID=A0AAV3R8E7_LITER
MNAEILRNLMNCNLTEKKVKPIFLEETDLVDGVIECEASVNVKIHNLKVGFVFFSSLQEKQRIMDSGPWCFDNQLLIMKDWFREADPLTLKVRGLKGDFFY